MMAVFQRAWTIAMRRLEPEDGNEVRTLSECGPGGSALTIISFSFAGAFKGCHCTHRRWEDLKAKY